MTYVLIFLSAFISFALHGAEIKVPVTQEMHAVESIKDVVMRPSKSTAQEDSAVYELKVISSYSNKGCVPATEQLVKRSQTNEKNGLVKRIDYDLLQDSIICIMLYDPVTVEFSLGDLRFPKDQKKPPRVFVNKVRARIEN